MLTDLISTGPMARPQRGIIYGVEGVGKTWLATQFPAPILIDTEAGSHRFDCSRINVGNDRELEEALDLLLNEKHSFETIVVDTIDWAERYLLQRVCRNNKVEAIEDLSYGKGWTYLREAFDKFLLCLNRFIYAGRHVIINGHAQVKRVQFPGLADPFDRFEPKLDKRNSDTVTEWADFQLFVNWDLRTAKTRDGAVRAIGGHDRLIYPVHTAAYDAKNRLGLTEPLKCEYAAIALLLQAVEERPRAGRAAAPPAVPPAVPPAPPAPPADSRTSHEPDEEEIGEPFLTDDERHAVEVILADLPQERLLVFLRERQLIHADEDHTMLGPQYCRRILSDPQGFKEAVGA